MISHWLLVKVGRCYLKKVNASKTGIIFGTSFFNEIERWAILDKKRKTEKRIKGAIIRSIQQVQHSQFSNQIIRGPQQSLTVHGHPVAPYRLPGIPSRRLDLIIAG